MIRRSARAPRADGRRRDRLARHGGRADAARSRACTAWSRRGGRVSDLLPALAPLAELVDGPRGARPSATGTTRIASCRATSRSAPQRFVIGPRSKHALVRAHPPRVSRRRAARGRSRADRILAGEYDLLGYRGASVRSPIVDSGPHATCRTGTLDPVHERRAPRDVLVDRAVSRSRVRRSQDHLGAQSPSALARARARVLADRRAPVSRAMSSPSSTSWLDANPPLIGINWASMLELAFRSLSWLWAIQLLRRGSDERTTTDRARRGSSICCSRSIASSTHIERNLSHYFSPNTHLLGEALALYVAGRALPELAASAAARGDRPADPAGRRSAVRSPPTADTASARRTTTATRSTSICSR